jgi:hypothetical protein
VTEIEKKARPKRKLLGHTTLHPPREAEWRSDCLKDCWPMIGSELFHSLAFPPQCLTSIDRRVRYAQTLGSMTPIGCWILSFFNIFFGYSFLVGFYTLFVGFLIAIWEFPVIYFWFAKVCELRLHCQRDSPLPRLTEGGPNQRFLS